MTHFLRVITPNAGMTLCCVFSTLTYVFVFHVLSQKITRKLAIDNSHTLRLYSNKLSMERIVP